MQETLETRLNRERRRLYLEGLPQPRVTLAEIGLVAGLLVLAVVGLVAIFT